MQQPESPDRSKWWVLNAGVLFDMLHRAANGEEPWLLYIELVANAAEEGQ